MYSATYFRSHTYRHYFFMELLTRDYFHRSLMSTLIDFITKNSHFCGKLLMHEEKKKLISIWLRVTYAYARKCYNLKSKTKSKQNNTSMQYRTYSLGALKSSKTAQSDTETP